MLSNLNTKQVFCLVFLTEINETSMEITTKINVPPCISPFRLLVSFLTATKISNFQTKISLYFFSYSSIFRSEKIGPWREAREKMGATL